jgi:hypothetical protein
MQMDERLREAGVHGHGALEIRHGRAFGLRHPQGQAVVEDSVAGQVLELRHVGHALGGDDAHVHQLAMRFRTLAGEESVEVEAIHLTQTVQAPAHQRLRPPRIPGLDARGPAPRADQPQRRHGEGGVQAHRLVVCPHRPIMVAAAEGLLPLEKGPQRWQ